MGIIIAKFRKKQSTFDILTNLDNEIVSIEDFQQRTQATQRKIVFRFLILALLLYCSLAGVFYLYFSEISDEQRLLWLSPLVGSPFIIYLLKILIRWYYNRKLVKNEKKLVTLKEKKKKILESVMETETYKVAKKILDKFQQEPKKMALVASPQPANFDSVIRQRITAAQSQLKGRSSYGGPETPQPTPTSRQLQFRTPAQPRLQNLQTPNQVALPPLPRTILPSNRSALDKMVDYLVGDGPSNRYALICQKCHNHNGMALKEEFEYISFSCAYCRTYNPARKKRLVMPAIEASSPALSNTKSSSSDTDDSDDPVVNEPPTPEEETEDTKVGESPNVGGESGDGDGSKKDD